MTAALGSARAGDALFLMDIDDFKVINDQHGHTVGDLVLREFSRRVTRCIRVDDVAIRYGGEEVLVILRRPGAAGIHLFDQRLRDELRTIKPTVTYSAGSVIVGGTELAAQALERADALLYEAKRSGRNRTHVEPAPS